MLNKVKDTRGVNKVLVDLIIFDCDGVLVDSELLSIDALHRLNLTQGGMLSKHEVIQNSKDAV